MQKISNAIFNPVEFDGIRMQSTIAAVIFVILLVVYILTH